MNELNDLGHAAALACVLNETDRLLFDIPARTVCIRGSPPIELAYAYYHTDKTGVHEYCVHCAGIATYLKSVARKTWWHTIAEHAFVQHEIPVDIVIQMIGAHEVRHRLQNVPQFTLYTPRTAYPFLFGHGFIRTPTYCNPLGKEVARIEYDADVITWMVLKRALERDGPLDKEELRTIIASSPGPMPQTMKVVRSQKMTP